HQPRRSLQHDARDCQAQLLVLTELPIPAVRFGQQWHQALETHAPQRMYVSRFAEVLDPTGIREHFTQAAARQIGSATREIENGLVFRPRDASTAPRPQPRKRPEQLTLARAGMCDDQQPLAATYAHAPLLEHIAPGERDDLELVQHHLSGFTLF